MSAPRAAIAVGMLLMLAGCGILRSARLAPNIDYAIDQEGRRIVTKNDVIAGNICLMRGAQVWQDDQRWAQVPIACYDPHDDVIVVARDAPSFVERHEDAHRHGWEHMR